MEWTRNRSIVTGLKTDLYSTRKLNVKPKVNIAKATKSLAYSYSITVHVNAKVGERRKIGRVKRVEGTVRAFNRPVATVEFVVEKDANLGDAIASGHDQSPEEIISSVAPNFEDGNLRTGDNDRLAQVLQHERQRRSRVRERVGAVEDDETIKEFVRSLRNRETR